MSLTRRQLKLLAKGLNPFQEYRPKMYAPLAVKPRKWSKARWRKWS